MALNPSGPMSLGGEITGQSIALELALSPTGVISLDQTDVRTLAGAASGTISLDLFYGKSSSVPLYLRSGDASSMAISPDKSRIAYFTTPTTTTMAVYVFNTSDFSLVYAKTATLHIVTATGTQGIYSATGAFDDSNNLFLARATYNGGNGISFVLYDSIGTLVASRSIYNTGTNGVSTAFYANGFFYTAGRISNDGSIIKRSASNLALSAQLLQNNRDVAASFVASEDLAYSMIDQYPYPVNNVAVTTLSTDSTVFKNQTPDPQYNASYKDFDYFGASLSWMSGNYLIEERMEGDWYIGMGFSGPTPDFLLNPKPYTFITNISSTNTVVSCYAIYHDSLAALKQSTQITEAWPFNFGAPYWVQGTLVSELDLTGAAIGPLRDNLIVIFGNDYYYNQWDEMIAYTGIHITIFNTLTNQVIASAVTSTSSRYGGAQSVLDIYGISVGTAQSFSPTLKINNEYLYLGKYITRTPQSSLDLVTVLNNIGGGITWTSATTTVSSVSVTTTSPTLSVRTMSGTDQTYASGINAYTPTPYITEVLP